RRWPAGDTALWRGPSGATVPLYSLPPDGYEFGSSLPVDSRAARERWTRIASVMSPRSATGVVLLLNGADHHARQAAQHRAVAALAAAAVPSRVQASSLRHLAARIADGAAHVALPIVEGELRDSYGYAWTLQGTFGVRSSQKRRNAMAERALVRDTEPWVALTEGGGDPATRANLHAAWRTVLQSHPHDTLCGTSIDAVASSMDERLRAAESQTNGLRENALMALAGHDRDEARAALDDAHPMVLLRNAAARRRGGVVELTLAATVASIAVGPGSAARQGSPRRILPWGVDGMPFQILSRRQTVALTEAPRAYPRADRVVEVQALGWVDSLAGYGVETRPQRRGARAAVPRPVRADAAALDNGLLRVSVSTEGEVTVEDRATARVVRRLLALEQHVEAGDLYTPAPRESLADPRVRAVSVTQRGPLRGEITFRYTLGEGRRGRGTCAIRLQLDAGLRAMRILLDGVNRDGDHRLRLRVETGLAGAFTVADAAFQPVRREPMHVPENEQRDERLVPTAPLHRWVARFGPQVGATVFSDGLTEYESAEDGAVFVTLFRAVGQLSRADLPERPGHAGWPAPTPGAQAIGPWQARLAFALHGADDWRTRQHIEQLAEDVLLPLRGESLRYNLREPLRAGGLELEGDGLTFSAAYPARQDGWIALRCVNARDETVRGRWKLGRSISSAVRARLDEAPLGELEVIDDAVEFDAAPREIVTILVR
ncbi:MAG TPA: glycoside hydrolase family 38 C-terminal domain-containing protein, partial [Gemmatimonadaceae bacterium]|nr:glycoside hydrolase family 38 C-terminal domain-containing protein [Gemmatimonadaceae bacterium]